MKKYNTFLLILLVLFVVSCIPLEREISEPVNEQELVYFNDSFSVASWNLQVFGDKKASDELLLKQYTDIIDRFDIVFLQEIRDNDGDSFVKLCNELPNKRCKLSSRAGTTIVKEQYGIIYDSDIELLDYYDYNLLEEYRAQFERPPIKVTFRIKDYTFSVYNIHVDPDEVYSELDSLEKITVNDGNVMVLGDLNADCGYYNVEDRLDYNTKTWFWIIGDDADTTTYGTDCSYDRIIVNENMFSDVIESGVYNDFRITREVSDHYPVFAVMRFR